MRPEGGLGAGSRGRLRGASQLPARGQVEINGRTNVIPPGLDKAKHSPPGNLSSPLGGWRSLSSDTRGGDLILATDAETVCASLLAVCARLLLDSEWAPIAMRLCYSRCWFGFTRSSPEGIARPPYLSLLHSCGRPALNQASGPQLKAEAAEVAACAIIAKLGLGFWGREESGTGTRKRGRAISSLE